jgi:glutamate 5-kinase
VNENDTISVSEIKFGDNDTLSAITAGMVAADFLFLMTDVDCLYTENPRKNPQAKAVCLVRDIEAVRRLVSTATLGSSLGTGGMETKLIAAELATGAGVATVITNSKSPSRILSIIASSSSSATNFSSSSSSDEPVIVSDEPADYTIFLPSASNLLPDRRWWVAHGLAPRGRVIIDEGAYRAIFRHNGGRLLPAGVVRVDGVFAAGQGVRIAVAWKRRNRSTDGHVLTGGSSTPDTPSLETSLTDLTLSDSHASLVEHVNEEDISEVGRGLANYNSVEIDRLKRMKRCALLFYSDKVGSLMVFFLKHRYREDLGLHRVGACRSGDHGESQAPLDIGAGGGSFLLGI